MNRPEAEQLLGGFALGILTEEEKALLFAKALEHQALFDALADEEALRELLTDPEARRELLAAFPSAAVPFWRRPAVLGLAASLFLLATTSLVLLRRGEMPVQRTIPTEQAQPPAVPTEPGKPQAAPAVPKAAKAMKAKAAPAAQAVAPEANLREDAAPGGAGAELTDRVAPPLAPAETAAPAPAATAGSAEKKAKGAMVASRAQLEVTPPALVSSLEHLPDGRVRLKVVWGPGGQLYVLLRTPAGAKVLAALKTAPEQDGLASSLFECPLGTQDKLDVYLLSAPVPEPAALPERGLPGGQHKRVYPE